MGLSEIQFVDDDNWGIFKYTFKSILRKVFRLSLYWEISIILSLVISAQAENLCISLYAKF